MGFVGLKQMLTRPKKDGGSWSSKAPTEKLVPVNLKTFVKIPWVSKRIISYHLPHGFHSKINLAR